MRSALTRFARAEAVEGHASAGAVRVHHGRVLPAHRHAADAGLRCPDRRLGPVSFGADWMLAGLWGGASLLLRRLPRRPLSAVPNARTGVARDGCCFALVRRAGAPRCPSECLSALTRIEVQEGGWNLPPSRLARIRALSNRHASGHFGALSRRWISPATKHRNRLGKRFGSTRPASRLGSLTR